VYPDGADRRAKACAEQEDCWDAGALHSFSRLCGVTHYYSAPEGVYTRLQVALPTWCYTTLGSHLSPPCHALLQVILPVEGSRVVMASDGLWDVLTFTKVYLKFVCTPPFLLTTCGATRGRQHAAAVCMRWRCLEDRQQLVVQTWVVTATPEAHRCCITLTCKQTDSVTKPACVWVDCLQALKLTRSKPTGAAASTLVTAVSRDLRTMDDASIIIIDLLPTEGTSFPTVALKANPKGSEKPGEVPPGPRAD
jgi:hypothetical protein